VLADYLALEPVGKSKSQHFPQSEVRYVKRAYPAKAR